MDQFREPKFDPEHLFPSLSPNDKCERSYSFEKKRVYVLTSRVHPGETPASFVFNGFLEFLLKKDDPRSKMLRKQFVFKLIPMLNPDGVARGYYRTDQLGVNLNRVYLDPSHIKHPSIYAVKSLLVYHHINNRISKEHDNLNFEHIFKLESNTDKTQGSIVFTENEADLDDNWDLDKLDINSPELETALLSSSYWKHNNAKILEKLKSHLNEDHVTCINKIDPIKSGSLTRLNKCEPNSNQDFVDKEVKIGNENSDDDCNSCANEFLTTDIKQNSPHLNDPRLALINPLWSGIAFYVDLHGHAAKRGCFIYGNSIDNELYQIENVLFAKLISFSSQHFDFDGCNFSIKNMFMKDKREGLSKEGSGRVAMFKTLGIIHSYTLECSYAAGRVMNTIPPAINTTNNPNQRNGAISPSLHTDIPPKFIIEHYADVGKGLALAALDISETNPHSRIPNTSFSSLEAVRNWIKFYIRSKNGGAVTSNTSYSNKDAHFKRSKQSNNNKQQQQQSNKMKNSKLVSSSVKSINAVDSIRNSDNQKDGLYNNNNKKLNSGSNLLGSIQNRRNFLRTSSVMTMLKPSTSLDSKNKLINEFDSSPLDNRSQQRLSVGSIVSESCNNTNKSNDNNIINEDGNCLKSISSAPQFSTCSSNMANVNITNKPLGTIRKNSDESLNNENSIEMRKKNSTEYNMLGKLNSTHWYLPDEHDVKETVVETVVKEPIMRKKIEPFPSRSNKDNLIKQSPSKAINRKLLPLSKSYPNQNKSRSNHSSVNSDYLTSKHSTTGKVGKTEETDYIESKTYQEKYILRKSIKNSASLTKKNSKLIENSAAIELAKNDTDELVSHKGITDLKHVIRN